MGQLELTARRQASWSLTANKLKARLDSARRSVFILSALGAVFATVASQLGEGPVRRWIAIASAVVLGVATFLTGRLVTSAHVGGWVRARAAAEALKREAFKCAAGAAPYDDPVAAEQALTKERDAIERGVDDLSASLEEAEKAGSAPSARIGPDEYIAKRVRAAVSGFYRPRALRFQKVGFRLRAVEFALALIATIITAVVGLNEQKYIVGAWPFDLAALTAVLTTLGALVLAHVESARYDFLVTTYRATARRLEDALADVNTVPPVPSKEWSDFVERCETIIASENNSWVAKWTGQPNTQPGAPG